MVCVSYVKTSSMFQHQNVEQPAPNEKTAKLLHIVLFLRLGGNLFNYLDLKATFCHLCFISLAAFPFL